MVHQDWPKAFDKGGPVDVIFIDFAKAFDLVNHSVPLNKLYKYGIRGSLLDWCRDYLTNRRQRVVVKREVSDWLTVTSCVLQGSLLGPLFFIIYINDLPGLSVGIAPLPYMLMIANYRGSSILLKILHPFRVTLIRFLTGAMRIK